MRDIGRGGGVGLSIVSAALIIYGLLNILITLILIFLVGFAFLLFPIGWVSLIFGAIYVGLGFGLLDRQVWAFYGTLTFLAVAVLLYFSNIFWLGSLYEMFILLHIAIHLLIITYVALHRNEFIITPFKKEVEKPALDEELLKDAVCAECGSSNLLILRDGSGTCNKCGHVFSDFLEASE